MGAWGYEPYGSDEGADWLAYTLRDFDYNNVEETILNFTGGEEEYDSIRSAAFLLQKLCRPFVWSSLKSQHDPKLLIQQAISILEKMITCDDEEWTFLDMWDHDLGDETGIVEAVKEQIDELQERLKEWN